MPAHRTHVALHVTTKRALSLQGRRTFDLTGHTYIALDVLALDTAYIGAAFPPKIVLLLRGLELPNQH